MVKMMNELEKLIKEYLQGILAIIGERAEIMLRQGTKEVLVNLSGDISFTGRDQRTMQALSHLLEVFVKRKLNKTQRIYLDVNGYKWQRQEELKKMALVLAEEVKREHKRIRLNPMEAYERKAIHEALSSFEGVKTYSEGMGGERRVIIEPDDL